MLCDSIQYCTHHFPQCTGRQVKEINPYSTDVLVVSYQELNTRNTFQEVREDLQHLYER